MSGDNKQTRRKALGTMGAGLGAIFTGTGLASANTNKPTQGSDDSKTDWIAVEDGRFVLHLDEYDVNTSVRRMYENSVAQFNTEIEAGDLYLKWVENDSSSAQSSVLSRGEQPNSSGSGQYVLRLPDGPAYSEDKGGNSDGLVSTNSTNTCNKSGLKVRKYGGWIPGEYFVNIFLSKGDIGNIDAIAGFGSVSGAAIKQYLLSDVSFAAIAGLSGPAIVAITVAVAGVWLAVNLKDHGCGVKIKTGYSPVNPSYQVPTVVSQG